MILESAGSAGLETALPSTAAGTWRKSEETGIQCAREEEEPGPQLRRPGLLAERKGLGGRQPGGTKTANVTVTRAEPVSGVSQVGGSQGWGLAAELGTSANRADGPVGVWHKQPSRAWKGGPLALGGGWALVEGLQ